MALQQIDSLSGGQKSRVAFAVLCGHNPNFLVLGKFSILIQYFVTFAIHIHIHGFEILHLGLARM